MIYIKSSRNSMTAKLVRITNKIGVGKTFTFADCGLPSSSFYQSVEILVNNKVVSKNPKKAGTYTILAVAECRTSSMGMAKGQRMFELPEVLPTGKWASLFMYAPPIPQGIGTVYQKEW